jgi:hypothetical protein
MINIITSFYIPINDKIRETELKYALNKNVNNNMVSKIHLFLDNEVDETYINDMKSLNKQFEDKVNVIRVGGQPLYNELFEYANTQELLGNICMVCNGDIWLHNVTTPVLFSFLMEYPVVYALARHEQDGTPPLTNELTAKSYGGCHDAFVFKSPIHPGIFGRITHKQNIWGSENVVIDALVDYHYTVANPCLQMIIIHEHDMLRENRIEENRPSIKHRDLRIGPCSIYVKNGKYYAPRLSLPRFSIEIKKTPSIFMTEEDEKTTQLTETTNNINAMTMPLYATHKKYNRFFLM